MTTLSTQSRFGAVRWFLFAATAIVVGNVLIAGQYAERMASPVPEWVVGFDLFVLIPALYLVIVRPPLKKALLACLGLFSFGVLAGSLIIPAQDKQVWLLLESLRWVVLGGLVLMQLALIVAVLRDITCARKAANVEQAIHAAIAKRVGDTGVLSLLQADARVWLYLFVRRVDRFVFGGSSFYARIHDANASNQMAFMVLIAVEMPVAHVIIHLFHPGLAWLVTALTAYGLLFLYADYRATLLRPTTLEADVLHVRSGVLGDVRIPYAAIESIEPANSRPPRTAESLRFVGTGTANVTLVLRADTRLCTLFGLRRIRHVHLGIDEPARFRAELVVRLPV